MSVDPELVGGGGGAASISIAGAGTLGLDSAAGATSVFVLCTGVGGRGEAPATELVLDLGVDIFHCVGLSSTLSY